MYDDVLFNIFIFLAAACIAVPLASRFKLGSVLGYFTAGILIGPYGLSLITNTEQIIYFGEFGVIMMLFLIGLEMARQSFPRLKIYARAHNRRHVYELNMLGITYFKREMFDSSLNMAQEIMIALGGGREDMLVKAELFKRYDESTLLKSFSFFGSEPELVNFSKLRQDELNNILQNDASPNPAKTEIKSGHASD